MSGVAKVLFVGGAIIMTPIIYNAVTTYLAADKIDFMPTGISNLDVSHGSLDFNLNYSLSNPSNKEIDVTYLLLNLSFENGPTVATIVKTDKLQILPGATVNGSVPVVCSDLVHLGVDLLSNIISWIQTKSIQLPKNLRLAGRTIANGFTVPFDTKISLPV